MNTPPLTQTDLLALLRRTTDEGWLNAMLAQPDGLAVINAWLAIFAKASEAVSGQVDCSMISTAPAGRLWRLHPHASTNRYDRQCYDPEGLHVRHQPWR